ncbi:2OG-Fe dioxygenase family protein [Streptomyces sp. LP05-1]|uniref:2OG-Fe dioxygenase family protein n=1 Tax=Streptomyces pyxinae TaxID=2970734 RepID=A0ABT2CKV5_9ACTN|nr:2OG-Fe dioxygenase family protein [Streptomyces sp. LP05-1]MCS0638052.1 2OG-Fe dioxygenase family protein [Streptomyces sp. LP05-1]
METVVETVIESVHRDLVSRGAVALRPDEVSACAGIAPGEWTRFAGHWEDLAVDPYAAEHGTRRLRRYGAFLLTAGGRLTPRPYEAFVQPDASNPMYVDVDRHFEPLTASFAADPVLAALAGLLVRAAGCLEERDEWLFKVHPFRVTAHAGQDGRPTPEGRHRDGVTLVSSLLIGRENATGGQSSVYGADGERVLRTTLAEPGSLLLGDDRRTLHEVTPVRPVDEARPARRDVLVMTLLSP